MKFYEWEKTEDINELKAELRRLQNEKEILRSALVFITTFEPSREGYIKGKSFNQIHAAAFHALSSIRKEQSK